MELSLTHLKIIVLFCFLIMTFLFGMVPVIFVRYMNKKVSKETRQPDRNIYFHSEGQQGNTMSKYKRIMSFLNCFAGGVFLATCFLELFPTVQRQLLLMLLKSNSDYKGFPAAEFVMIFGLFLILIVEQIVLTVKERSSGDSSPDPRQDERQPILQGKRSFSGSIIKKHSFGSTGESKNCPQRNPIRANGATENDQTDGIQRQRAPSSYSIESINGDHGASDNDHQQEQTPSGKHPQQHSQLRAMLLLLALSMHSVFEGIAVGLQAKVESVLNIYAALTIHKSILSFSLGMNLVQSNISTASSVKSVVGFSLSSPVGVAIGILIMDLWTSTNSIIFQGVLQGIASGTFLYIIFFEILPKEFNCEGDRILKVLFLIIGYATVTGIIFLGDDAESPMCKNADDVNT